MEVNKFKEAAKIVITRYSDESTAQERNLRQKNVKPNIFRNKLILKLEKEKMLDRRR
jgi:hypothetical protein